MKKIVLNITITLLGIYLFICTLLYFMQEKLIFFPQKLPKDFRFEFEQKFEELSIETKDHQLLDALLFKAHTSKGVIFYLHGNAGSLASWAEVAETYTALDYDIFFLDYRGYGKSEGSISSEQQLFEDVQCAYDELKKRYPENRIVVMGYSIGTGSAAKVACDNSAGLLILQAPYYSLVDLMKHNYPILPAFILKYKFETNKYMKACRMPVVLFHGDQDEVIYYGSSLKLKGNFKNRDTLITLKGQSHNGITDNEEYKKAMFSLLRGPNTGYRN